MKSTFTNTYTNAYIIGEKLAKEHNCLKPLYKQMKDISEQYKNNLKNAGIKLVPTNDIYDIDIMKLQWEGFLTEIIPDAKEISEKIPEFQQGF